jgi:uncharacterized protein YutE (UPF0331/DUF86 family)
MVDVEKIYTYLSELETYLSRLRELRKAPKEEFFGSWQGRELVHRHLHLAIETFLAVGEMLIAELGLRKPDIYADVPDILGERGIVGKELRDKLIDLARFRNVVVHEYVKLDPERVYEHLQADPEILEEFLEAVKNFIRAYGK